MWKSGEDPDARLELLSAKLDSDELQLLRLDSDGLQLLTSKLDSFISAPLSIQVRFWPSLLSHSSIGLILVVVSFHANHNAVDN